MSILSLDGSLAGRAPGDLGVKRIAVVQLQDGPGNDRETFFRAVDAVSRLLPPYWSSVMQVVAVQRS